MRPELVLMRIAHHQQPRYPIFGPWCPSPFHRDSKRFFTGVGHWDPNQDFHFGAIGVGGVIRTYTVQTEDNGAYGITPIYAYQLYLVYGEQDSNTINKRPKVVDVQLGNFEYIPDRPDEIVFFQLNSTRILFAKLPVKSRKSILDRSFSKVFCIGTHPSSIVCISVRVDGLVLLSAASDGSIRAWKLSNGLMLFETTQSISPPKSYCISPFNTRLPEEKCDICGEASESSWTYSQILLFFSQSSGLAMGCFDGLLRLWKIPCNDLGSINKNKDLELFYEETLLPSSNAHVTALAMHSPNTCRDAEQGAEYYTNNFNNVSASMNSKELIALGTIEGGLMVWTQYNGSHGWLPQWLKISSGVTISCLNFRRDGGLLAVGASISFMSSTKTFFCKNSKGLVDKVHLYETSNWTCVRSLSFNSRIGLCSFFKSSNITELLNSNKEEDFDKNSNLFLNLLMVLTNDGPEIHLIPQLNVSTNEAQQKLILPKTVKWADSKIQNMKRKLKVKDKFKPIVNQKDIPKTNWDISINEIEVGHKIGQHLIKDDTFRDKESFTLQLQGGQSNVVCSKLERNWSTYNILKGETYKQFKKHNDDKRLNGQLHSNNAIIDKVFHLKPHQQTKVDNDCNLQFTNDNPNVVDYKNVDHKILIKSNYNEEDASKAIKSETIQKMDKSNSIQDEIESQINMKNKNQCCPTCKLSIPSNEISTRDYKLDKKSIFQHHCIDGSNLKSLYNEKLSNTNKCNNIHVDQVESSITSKLKNEINNHMMTEPEQAPICKPLLNHLYAPLPQAHPPHDVDAALYHLHHPNICPLHGLHGLHGNESRRLAAPSFEPQNQARVSVACSANITSTTSHDDDGDSQSDGEFLSIDVSMEEDYEGEDQDLLQRESEDGGGGSWSAVRPVDDLWRKVQWKAEKHCQEVAQSSFQGVLHCQASLPALHEEDVGIDRGNFGGGLLEDERNGFHIPIRSSGGSRLNLRKSRSPFRSATFARSFQECRKERPMSTPIQERKIGSPGRNLVPECRLQRYSVGNPVWMSHSRKSGNVGSRGVTRKEDVAVSLHPSPSFRNADRFRSKSAELKKPRFCTGINRGMGETMPEHAAKKTLKVLPLVALHRDKAKSVWNRKANQKEWDAGHRGCCSQHWVSLLDKNEKVCQTKGQKVSANLSSSPKAKFAETATQKLQVARSLDLSSTSLSSVKSTVDDMGRPQSASLPKQIRNTTLSIDTPRSSSTCSSSRKPSIDVSPARKLKNPEYNSSARLLAKMEALKNETFTEPKALRIAKEHGIVLDKEDEAALKKFLQSEPCPSLERQRNKPREKYFNLCNISTPAESSVAAMRKTQKQLKPKACALGIQVRPSTLDPCPQMFLKPGDHNLKNLTDELENGWIERCREAHTTTKAYKSSHT